MSTPTRWVHHLRINLALHQLQDGAGHPLLLLARPGRAHTGTGAGIRVGVARSRLGSRLHRPRRLRRPERRRLHGRGADGRRGRGARRDRPVDRARPRARRLRRAAHRRRPPSHGPRRRALRRPGHRRRGNRARRPRCSSVSPTATPSRLPIRSRWPSSPATCDRPTTRRRSLVRPSTLSELATPLTVCARWRPPWLEAVASEPGVAEGSIEDALASYAAS